MENILLPCKKCGAEPEVVIKTTRKLLIPTKIYVVKCDECNCAVGERSKRKAVMNWNRLYGSVNKTGV